jgi:hypothetical protein
VNAFSPSSRLRPNASAWKSHRQVDTESVDRGQSRSCWSKRPGDPNDDHAARQLLLEPSRAPSHTCRAARRRRAGRRARRELRTRRPGSDLDRSARRDACSPSRRAAEPISSARPTTPRSAGPTVEASTPTTQEATSAEETPRRSGHRRILARVGAPEARITGTWTGKAVDRAYRAGCPVRLAAPVVEVADRAGRLARLSDWRAYQAREASRPASSRGCVMKGEWPASSSTTSRR